MALSRGHALSAKKLQSYDRAPLRFAEDYRVTALQCHVLKA
jgi:hypothetical protein